MYDIEKLRHTVNSIITYDQYDIVKIPQKIYSYVDKKNFLAFYSPFLLNTPQYLP